MNNLERCVEMKVVERWFALGQEFDSEEKAWDAVADQHLRRHVMKMAAELQAIKCPYCAGKQWHPTPADTCVEGWKWPENKFINAVWLRLFPHVDGFECHKSRSGICTGDDDSRHPKPYSEPCMTAIREWKRQKASELYEAQLAQESYDPFEIIEEIEKPVDP